LPSNLPREEFFNRLRTVIEEASDRLVASGRAEQARLFGRVSDTVKA